MKHSEVDKLNRNHYKKTLTFNLNGADLGENEYKTDRVASGIEGLDELIEGGFERNSVILICGDAGTGKTTFALQFLYNGIVKYNEPGIFITFEESKDSLYRHVSNYGWNFEDLEKENKFAIVEYRPHQIAELLREGGGAIRDVIESIKAKRIVVDSLTSYSMLFKTPYESREAILTLFNMLRSWKCTSMVISEVTANFDRRDNIGIEFLTDAALLLYYSRQGGTKVRALEILKMRGTKHIDKICPIRFDREGIIVFPKESVFGEI